MGRRCLPLLESFEGSDYRLGFDVLSDWILHDYSSCRRPAVSFVAPSHHSLQAFRIGWLELLVFHWSHS